MTVLTERLGHRDRQETMVPMALMALTERSGHRDRLD
jgi:hypothetical protein